MAELHRITYSDGEVVNFRSVSLRPPDRVFVGAEGCLVLYWFSAEKTPNGAALRRASIEFASDGLVLHEENRSIAHSAVQLCPTALFAVQRAVAFVDSEQTPVQL